MLSLSKKFGQFQTNDTSAFQTRPMRLRVAEPIWDAAVLKLYLAHRFPEERTYYTIFLRLSVKGCKIKLSLAQDGLGRTVGSEGMSQVRTSEEANSASVRVTLFATSRFVEGGSLSKSYLSNDIAAADICRRERGRSLGIPKRLLSRVHR